MFFHKSTKKPTKITTKKQIKDIKKNPYEFKYKTQEIR